MSNAAEVIDEGFTPSEPEEFDAPLHAVQVLAERQLSRRHLLPFIQKANPGYMPGWVHKLICTKLEEFEQKIQYAMAHKLPGPRLMLFMPPRHGKSEIASRSYPAWYLGRNPSHEIVACSYASSLALKFSRKARSLYTSDMFSSVFPEAKLDPDARSAENWLTDKGGGYMAAGVNGPITGNGFHLGIIDDPVKNREEAESETVRESIKDWYTSTFLTRQAPGAGILVILTRWHDDDLAGWLLELMKNDAGDEWDVIKFPAIATQDEAYRKKGEPLHADRYPLAILDRIKKGVGNRDWESLYQQNPTADDGDYFTKSMLKYYRDHELPPRERMTFYQAWDLAIGKNETNDWTVGTTVGVDDHGRIWITDVVRGRWDGYEIVEKILDAYETWTPMHVGLEKGQISMAIGPHLQKRIEERELWEFPYDESAFLKTGRNDKQARARSIQGRMRAGKVFFPETATWLQELVNELLRFPNGVHDDQVDSLAWIGIMLGLFTAPNLKKEDTTPAWVRKYLKRGKKPSTTAMTA